MSLDDEDSLRQKSAALEAGLPIIRPRFQDDLSAEELEKRPANGESYVVDTTGSGPMDTGLPAPAVRSLSPTLSDSSEEIILFAGRTVDDSKLAVRESAGAFSRTTASGQKSPCPRQSYRPPIGLGVDGSTVGRADARSSSESHTSGVAQHSGRHTPIPSNLGGTFHKRGSYFDRSQATGSSVQDSAMLDRHRKRRRRNRKFEDEHVENAVLADYIANMQGCDESESGSISHDEDTAVRDPVTEGHFNAQHREDFQDSLAWNDSDLCDFNDLSTSDEVLGTIQHILSKRERATGAQYLIVWEGYSVDDARWIPHSSLMMEGAAEKILLFESKMGLKKHSSSKDDYEDSSTEENGLHDSTDEDLEDLKDEQDLEDRRLASLTDEQIVRLLSKQEELGMGSNELMLFDAMDDDDDGDSEDDANEVGLEFSKNSHVNNLLHSTRSRGPRTRGSARQYPSATLLADVLDQDEYRGFDVMDCTRPSLKKQSKARKGALPFQLSDSDLENSLQTAWENDRNTKKAKKKEREERRAQGLLGARNQGKTNLSVKYKEGLTMDEVKSEIKSFLISEHQR